MAHGSPVAAPAAERHEPVPGPVVLGSGSCGGTLGELFQGPIAWGRRLEIAIASLAFSGRTTCQYVLDPLARAAHSDGLEDRPKTARALGLLLSQHGVVLPPGRWCFASDLDVGKGMASSTADIVAAIRCVARIAGRRFRTRDVMNVLRHVERSDSVFLDEAALYLSERHHVVVRFGRWLGYTAAYMVEPTMVDTETMRDCLLEHYRRHAVEYRRALDSFLAGAVQRDPYLVARAATESSRLSQRCLPKRWFAALRSAMRCVSADGIFVAHTGSIVGYLFVAPPTGVQRAEITALFERLGERVRFDRVGWTDA